MRTSAGLLMYRCKPDLEVLLVHPGGPLWQNKDAGAWSIPKGEYTTGEDPLTVAIREFGEETGFTVAGNFIALSKVKRKSGKLISAWAIAGDIAAEKITSNHFTMEWPYRSGRYQSFPEVDKAGWFTPNEARIKLNTAQVAFVDELLHLLEDHG